MGVGLEEKDEEIVITVDGIVLTDPPSILRRLAKKKEKWLLEALERRDSTNLKKNAEGQQAPAFSIAWGIAGWVDKHRHERTAFYGPKSTFTDTEVYILLKQRLLLWPTGLKQSICSGGASSARCYCGAICQTASHLLNVPWEARGHGLPLRQVPRTRHNDALQHLIFALFPEGPTKGTWALVRAEGSKSKPAMRAHPDFSSLRTELDRWVAEQLLAEEDGTQHYRTDLIVASTDLKQIIIYDMCFGSDDKLAFEDALIRTWPAQKEPDEPKMGLRFWTSDFFDKEGCITDKGHQRLQGSKPYHVFKHARYVRRYSKLKYRLLSFLPINWKVLVLPIALGVIGLVPDFTRFHLQRTLGLQEANTLVKLFIQTSQRAAVQAWRAWRLEGQVGPS